MTNFDDISSKENLVNNDFKVIIKGSDGRSGYKRNNCRDFKDSVSSKNSAKLSNKEIKDLILSK